jgi:hypothetical protein
MGHSHAPPLSFPLTRGSFASHKSTWVLGFPKCPQDPIYLLLGLHMGVAWPGLEVYGPPSHGGSFSLLLLQALGLSTGPTVSNGPVGGYDPLALV